MERRSRCSCLVRASKQMYPTTTFWTVFSFFRLFLVLTSPIGTVVSQVTDDFISVDCGGTGFVDPTTTMKWSIDKSYLDSEEQLSGDGIAVQAMVNLDDSTAATLDNADVIKTAMAFVPTINSPSKYCYKFPVQSNRSYLVRAMFPNTQLTNVPTSLRAKNVSLIGYSTRFYFTVDSTFISTIELAEHEIKTVELVVIPLDASMDICLVPLEDRSSMPVISSIELRPLKEEMYMEGRDFTSSGGGNAEGKNKGLRSTYLITVSRLNFGGNVSLPAVRFPYDPYDRLWYPAKSNSSELIKYANTSSTVGAVDGFPNENPPVNVLESAWEGRTMYSNISFTFNNSEGRPIPSFYLNMYFFDVKPGTSGGIRRVNINLDDASNDSEFLWGKEGRVESNGTWRWYNHKQNLAVGSTVFRIEPSPNSTLPAMVNAFEIYGEFEAATQRTREIDDSTIRDFSKNFSNRIDTSGDPCLPVPWNWIVCSIEDPPGITQINLTGIGVNGELTTDFGLLNRLTVLDLSNNKFSGFLPQSLVNVSNLRELNIADNELSGTLPQFKPQSFSDLKTLSLRNNNFTGNLSSLFNGLDFDSSISSIDLSNNSFNGSIPENVTQLKTLEVLDLSFNLLSGKLDVEVIKLPALRILNLQNNTLTDKVPQEIWSSESKLLTVNLNGNKFKQLDLTTWCQTVVNRGNLDEFPQQVNLVSNDIDDVSLPCLDQVEQLRRSEGWFPSSDGFILLGENQWCKTMGKDRSYLAHRYFCRSSEFEDFWNAPDGADATQIIIAAVIGGILFLVMACVLILVLWRSWKRMKDLRQIQEALAKEDVRPPFFKYEDLKAATKDFSQENELGKGAFGAVYKAVLADGSTVAVKLLFPTDQNIADFLREMVLITGIKHRHLIQLKGCCVRDKRRLLVYEYAENKNLAQALWDNGRCVGLTWPQRLKICIGIARGLCYLHEELQPRIIHRDIKPQNILLDKDWEAKIADFGLARPVDEESTQLATRIGGTLGYFSPEYATSGKLTEKLDVYSFGVLVLEIVGGRKCIDLSLSSTPEKMYLKDLAFQLFHEGKILDVAEKGLLETGSEEEILSVLKVALSCLHQNHEKRPPMSQVVTMLSGSSSADLAVDIVSGLRDQQRMYDGLFDTTITVKGKDKEEREDRALLQSTSSSDPQRLIELTVAKPR